MRNHVTAVAVEFTTICGLANLFFICFPLRLSFCDSVFFHLHVSFAPLISHVMFPPPASFRPLLRALSWMGWGLNRVTLRGLPEAKSDMVFFQNLVRR